MGRAWEGFELYIQSLEQCWSATNIYNIFAKPTKELPDLICKVLEIPGYEMYPSAILLHIALVTFIRRS